MSNAEITAHRLYEAMHLDSMSDEVKRHLMILMLSGDKKDEAEENTTRIPVSYEEALQMGAMDIEMAREDLHGYVDELSKEFDIR